MTQIRPVQLSDWDFWQRLDRHLPEGEFQEKVKRRQGYVLLSGQEPAALLRYNLFWDSIPFCTMLYVAAEHRRRGFGGQLMAHWEREMAAQGHGLVLTSTQVDENAQHFYRKLGYQDCGGLILTAPGYAQPMELFLSKELSASSQSHNREE